MFFFSFLLIVTKRSLIHDDFLDLLKEKNPIVVRFYDEHRPRSVQLNKDWHKFEKMYANASDITLAHINCGKNLRLCLQETAWDFPIVRLYINNSVKQYDGGMSYESLAKWTRENTGIQGADLQLDLLSPNNRTFNELLNNQKCVFVMFHTRQCKKCKHFMNSLKDIFAPIASVGSTASSSVA